MARMASPQSSRTRVRRLPHKQSDELNDLYALLDEAVLAHVGICEGDQPVVIPMACARDGDTLLLHGSTASRLMTDLASGVRACATVTILDGLVYARSAFESSMHYRSAVVFGQAEAVADDAKERALLTLTEHLMPGRAAELRAPTRKELAATRIVGLPIAEWSLKASSAPPEDDPLDLDAPVWAGVLPLRLTPGEPIDAPDLRATRSAPDYVRGRFSPTR